MVHWDLGRDALFAMLLNPSMDRGSKPIIELEKTIDSVERVMAVRIM